MSDHCPLGYLLFLLNVFHLKTLIELLGETHIIRTLILIIIIRAGTPLSVIPSTLTGNQNVLIPKFNIFWIPAKVEGITDERGTSADYYYL